VQPSLKMTAELFKYHYTLYYYDQAGSLVKTVPPEGVALLDSSGLNMVKQWRRLQNTYDTTGGVSFFYRHAGVVAKIESNKLW
jgi:hypothetical protein